MTESIPLRILIVEDDPDTVSNLSDILELDDHTITSASSAAELFESRSLVDADVVLLDRKLPDATAETLLPRLKSTVPDADIIVVTGHADLESAIAALRLGAADYILKPISPEALRAGLRRIAARRKAEERARGLGRILENSLGEVYIFDAETFRYREVNRGARENLGYSLDELREMSAYEVKPGLTAEALAGILRPLSEGRVDHLRYESVHRRKDGSEYPVEIHVNRASLDFRPVFVSFAVDLTERKRGEGKLLQAQRLAAIGEAMTSLAHESRNALQRSQAALEMLARRIVDRPEALGLVGRVQVAQDDLHRLYEEVRAYAAAPKCMSADACEPGDVIATAWNDLAVARHGRRASLVMNGTFDHVRCRGDLFALRQVFRNILENALAASDPCEIRVSCSPAKLGDQAAICISVKDNGPGLTPEERKRIFEAFFTTKTHGTGLGMAICQRLIQAQGGEIGIGETGPGAEILVTLPRVASDFSDGATDG